MIPLAIPLPLRLAHLEEALGSPAPDLGALGAPLELAQLFPLLLAAAVRRGTGLPGLSPRAIVEAAERAGGDGALPLSTVGSLRRMLDQAARRVREAGAWEEAAPLWWEPLPSPSVAGSTAAALAADGLRLPGDAELAAAFQGEAARRWLALPDLLPAELAAAVGAELEAAWTAGLLPLAREGVGAAGRLSARRSDEVLYLNGTERGLPAAAPRVAALVQGLLAGLAERLAAVGEAGLAAPQTAMLTRYPAPSVGYAPHIDNPGGAADSGRALTFVLYLNPPERPCAGGEIALWDAGRKTGEAPAAVLPARGGSAVLFDARTIPHQVLPLQEGPERWALTVWLQAGRPPAGEPPLPPLAVEDVLAGVAAPALPAGTVLLREIDGPDPAGRIRTGRGAGRGATPRAGVVATVRGAGEALFGWCEHHLAQGFAHLLLVFDRLEEPEERALAGRLEERFRGRLTVWSAAETAARRWPELPESPALAAAREWAARGDSSYAVSARQALHATAALAAARRGELSGAPLDWLLHLDGDELFVLQGAGQGGATLAEHFSAVESAGYRQVRYANHELLLPHPPGAPYRFKLNPRLAEARLGSVGWSELIDFLKMRQTDRRPYYQGYFNGKSAVAVAAGREAAGVHGWTLEPREEPALAAFLAGPAILHLLCPTAAGFVRKFLAKAESPIPEVPLPFPPSPIEETVMAEIARLRAAGAGRAALEARLAGLFAELTCFTPSEIGLLEAAGLVCQEWGDGPAPA